MVERTCMCLVTIYICVRCFSGTDNHKTCECEDLYINRVYADCFDDRNGLICLGRGGQA